PLAAEQAGVRRHGGQRAGRFVPFFALTAVPAFAWLPAGAAAESEGGAEA
ncbi:MAG: hypothetical protein QOE61_6880, partial [Micromonosporaceae bacterium]|nr:hypothetical protein [Micromonosporaceae bacterium]